MIFSSVVASVGVGLLSTLKPNSSPAHWIGYQIIFGLGVGSGMQQPMLAAQIVLELKDVPVATSILMFAQLLGGAMFISIGQNVFTKAPTVPFPFANLRKPNGNGMETVTNGYKRFANGSFELVQYPGHIRSTWCRTCVIRHGHVIATRISDMQA
jgi:hypothetical protein